MEISALCVNPDSIYKSFNIDCWDINRDALKFNNNNVVICHPPCRAFGKLKHFSKHTELDFLLADFCIYTIRTNGGILEHPVESSLFKTKLVRPGSTDNFGGFSLYINQHDFGHKALKRTLLYFCGLNINQVPALPLNFNVITHCIGTPKQKDKNIVIKKEISVKERSATPPALALFLIECCKIIIKNKL